MKVTKSRARFLLIAGYIAMLIGAIDPMEGSLLILPGSGLVAFGTFFSDEERWIIIYRLWYSSWSLSAWALYGWPLCWVALAGLPRTLCGGDYSSCRTRSAGQWASGARTHRAGYCGLASSWGYGTW